MDVIERGIQLAQESLSLLGKAIGPIATKWQTGADVSDILQTTLAKQIADHIEENPNDPEVLTAIVECGGKLNLINLAKIALKAQFQLLPEARPDLIDDDWFANFKEKCRTCSDEDMATLWAQLLAGEANEPGSYSRKTVNILADMSKADAELFSNLCRFQLMDVPGQGHGRFPVIVKMGDVSAPYKRHGITPASLRTLENIGLIRFGFDSADGPAMSTSIGRDVIAHSDGFLNFARARPNSANVNIGGKCSDLLSHLCI